MERLHFKLRATHWEGEEGAERKCRSIHFVDCSYDIIGRNLIQLLTYHPMRKHEIRVKRLKFFV